MKKQFFFSMLAATAMLASCGSDDAVVSGVDNQYNMVAGQPAFISLGIAMPSNNGTRANDNYQDGVDAEYAVKSGKLVLFKGASEMTATLFGQYDIPTSTFALDGTSTAITSSNTKYVQEITAPNLTSAENLYAYVILNQEGNATGLDLSLGQTYEAFSKKVFKAIGIANEAKGYGAENTTNGFVMTSVPYSLAAAGTAAPALGTKCTSLSKINASEVYDTQAAAAAAPAAACIYVERAAVKVDVTFSSSIVDPAGSAANVTLTGWGLGNTNNSASGYYNVRQVEDSWLQLFNEQCGTSTIKYRFASVSPFFSTGHDMGYRTYWGSDVNYDGKSGLNNAKMVDADYALASGASTFTYENTFDENSQIFANTTYVGFKTVLNDGATFYTIDGANNTALDLATLKTKLASNVDAQISTSIATIKAGITAAINADLSGANTIGGTSVSYDLVHNVTVSAKNPTTAKCTYTDKLALANVKVDGAAATSAQLTAINALIYTGVQTIAEKLDETLGGYTPDVVNEYTGGVTYYAVRIAHFGDTETPWSTDASSFGDYAKIYPTTGQSLDATPVNYGASRKAAWLGRWGILRNNWYSLNVTNIQGIGDAVPVDYSDTTNADSPGNTPDDNPKPKYYISAQIHILPWVKRIQGVVL